MAPAIEARRVWPLPGGAYALQGPQPGSNGHYSPDTQGCPRDQHRAEAGAPQRTKKIEASKKEGIKELRKEENCGVGSQ